MWARLVSIWMYEGGSLVSFLNYMKRASAGKLMASLVYILLPKWDEGLQVKQIVRAHLISSLCSTPHSFLQKKDPDMYHDMMTIIHLCIGCIQLSDFGYTKVRHSGTIPLRLHSDPPLCSPMRRSNPKFGHILTLRRARE